MTKKRPPQPMVWHQTTGLGRIPSEGSLAKGWRVSRSFVIALDSFALFQKLKVCVSGHFGGSHVTPDYFGVYFFVGRNNDRPADSCFNIGAVVSLLPVKNKTSFLEDALKGFPVNGS